MIKRALGVAGIGLGLGLLASLLAPLPSFTSEPPSSYQRYLLKGSIIDRDGASLYLCIGNHDGATSGQVLEVFRVHRLAGAGKAPAVRFVRRKVGTLRIDEVVDDHFARAMMVTGEAKKGDVVELERR